jgi:hypothetical protein
VEGKRRQAGLPIRRGPTPTPHPALVPLNAVLDRQRRLLAQLTHWEQSMALMPNPAGEVHYLYHEVGDEPIVWWEPLAWLPAVDQWLPHARGNATCVDQLIAFLKASLEVDDQIRLGLPRVADIVLADPGRVAKRSFLISTWLIENRATASDAGLLSDWQRVVDALVVVGVNRLAPYSE